MADDNVISARFGRQPEQADDSQYILSCPCGNTAFVLLKNGLCECTECGHASIIKWFMDE